MTVAQHEEEARKKELEELKEELEALRQAQVRGLGAEMVLTNFP